MSLCMCSEPGGWVGGHAPQHQGVKKRTVPKPAKQVTHAICGTQFYSIFFGCSTCCTSFSEISLWGYRSYNRLVTPHKYTVSGHFVSVCICVFQAFLQHPWNLKNFPVLLCLGSVCARECMCYTTMLLDNATENHFFLTPHNKLVKHFFLFLSNILLCVNVLLLHA